MKIVPFVLACFVAFGSISGCRRIYISAPTQPSPAPVVENKNVRFEFRVSGNANSVRVRYTSERDGQVQTVTSLPFFTTFSSSADNLFLNLEVTPISYSALVQYPFLSVQIFANGDLFREATSNDFFLYTISVNGTWRR